MEERIIDDEYARGIRLKKTKDGYVDVTDETATPSDDKTDETAPEELNAELEALDPESEGGEGDEGEEVTFEFPDMEEDDEDLVNLTPEEAIALRHKKEEAEAARIAEYTRLCEEGDELILTGSYKAAELKFEKALTLDEEAADAAFGYWRAKTSNFTEPDVLAEEYYQTGFESLENDLGDGAVEKIKANYHDVFAARVKQLSAEEEPLNATVTEKQSKRRSILKARISSAMKKVIATGVPMLIFLIAAIVFGVKITTRSDGLFLTLTIVFGVLCGICFVFFGVFTNKLVNALRMKHANEDLSSTEDGSKLLEIRAYKELYSHLIG
jgi:hypothetical protein